MYWPFDIISEGLTFYMALENLRAGQVQAYKRPMNKNIE